MSNNRNSFKDWYFEGEYFVSPEGDRFNELTLRACLYIRQMQVFSDVLYEKPTHNDIN